MLCDYYNLDLRQYQNQRQEFLKIVLNEKLTSACYERHRNNYLKRFKWTYDKAISSLGYHAIQKPNEFIPECFNNYYRLKSKSSLSASEYDTYEFVKAVVEDYKIYIQN